jgi:glycosyltransferase involved in cell wall biosynthesis
VPRVVGCRYAIDFVDDLGGAALRRASVSGGVTSMFWRWEGRRLRRYDALLASRASSSFAVNERDAAAIAPSVQTIPPAIGTHPSPDTGTKIVFTGNLFYEPNTEAATWMCRELAPRLAAMGVDPGDIVIAGRRPPGVLTRAAEEARVDLRPDVPDLTDVLVEAALVVAPVALGSGVQNKVLDAVGAARACVVSDFTNQVLGLVDGHSALVRDRTPEAFADAIVTLLGDPGLRQRLVKNALEQFACYTEEAVASEWRRHLHALLPRPIAGSGTVVAETS